MGNGIGPCDEIKIKLTSSSFRVENGILFFLGKKDFGKNIWRWGSERAGQNSW